MIVGQPLQWRVELGIVMPSENFEQLIAGKNQLRNHGHELIERVDAHADRLARYTRCGIAKFRQVADDGWAAVLGGDLA